MVGQRQRQQQQQQIIQSIASLKDIKGSSYKKIAEHLKREQNISISQGALLKLLKEMTKEGKLIYKNQLYKIKTKKSSTRRSESTSQCNLGSQSKLGPFAFTGRALAGTRSGIEEQQQQLAGMHAHSSEADRTQMSDYSLLQKPDLLTLIYFEFRCTLFKPGDTIKLFNKDTSQWNTCTLASNSFQRNVVNKPECKGGPKYIESTYNAQGNVQGRPLTTSTQPKEGGKFIRLLQNLYPFESCYSSDRGKVTFFGIPEKLDFFNTTHELLLTQGKALLKRWEEWCVQSAAGGGSALTQLTSANWNHIKNWGLQEVMHVHDSSIPTMDTPSGPSAALYYPSGTEHNSSNLQIDMSGLTQPWGGNTRLTPRAPAIIWLYNNSDIGQEILGYFDTGNGMDIYDMTGKKINQNQISSHGKDHFSKTGIETQLYRQLYILTSTQPQCGGAALTAIEGLRISSIIGIDGSTSTDLTCFGPLSIRSQSIVPRGQRDLDPVLQFTEKDRSALDHLSSQQSYFGAFNLPHAQYTISPGIWIIVDIPRMPHSILVILKGGKKFTIGAGYRNAPETGNPFGSGSAVPLLIYSPDTSIYSADEAEQRAQQFDQRLDYDMTKHQHIRKIGAYDPAIQSKLQEIIRGAQTLSQGGDPEFMTTFTMKQKEFGVYKTVPITSGTMNCTSLTLWITNQRNRTGVCAPGGIWTAVSGSSGPSGTAAMGTLEQYTPIGDDYMEEEGDDMEEEGDDMEEEELGGGSPKRRKYKHKKRRKQKTKRRRKRKTKRKRRGKKRKTRIKRKARIKKKTRRRR